MKKWLLLIFFVLISFSPFIEAVQQNHYVLGINGLKSATKPEEGFLYTNFFKDYRAHKLMDESGHPVPVKGALSLYMDLNIFSWFSGRCFLGGDYGCQLIIPLANLSAEATFEFLTLNLDSHGLRLSDIYMEPLNLTWRLGQLDLLFSYGVYAPTGKYQPLGLHNTGLGNWSHLPAFAFTYYFDKEKSWSLSAFTAYEIHHKKRGIDFRPGDNLTIDWGFGKTFFKALNVGIVGYAEWQITNDHGKDILPVIKDVKDRVFAIGPEVSLHIPNPKGKIIFRYEHEFGARARTEGNCWIGAVSLLF